MFVLDGLRLAVHRYIEGELERAFNSITVYEDSAPIQHLTVFQRVLVRMDVIERRQHSPDANHALIWQTSWTIPLVQMAVLVLDDHNFAVIERSAYNILLIINPYCERELQYGIPPAGKEMRESKLRAREATLEFGRIIERINPDIKVDDSNDSETARGLVRSLTAYHLS